MQIGELTRGFPQGLISNNETAKPTTNSGAGSVDRAIYPIIETDKPYQIDFPKFDLVDLPKVIKDSLKDVVLAKLFSPGNNPNTGLLDGFNENSSPIVDTLQSPNPIENSDEQVDISYSYSYSFSESFSLDLNLTDNQLSVDLNYSASFLEQQNYTDQTQGIEYSSLSTGERSLSLSLVAELGENGGSPSLISFDLTKSSTRTYSESLSQTLDVVANDATANQAENISQALINPIQQPFDGTTNSLNLTENNPNRFNLFPESTEEVLPTSAFSNGPLLAGSAQVDSRQNLISQQLLVSRQRLVNQLNQSLANNLKQIDQSELGENVANALITQYLQGLK